MIETQAISLSDPLGAEACGYNSYIGNFSHRASTL